MKFRDFLLLIHILLSLKVIAQKSETKPNIILISADDLGWSDIGCYGSEIKTPNLDKLANEGMRFTSFHNTAKCFSSRASLITGVYAHDCGYSKTHSNPITNAVTIGKVLKGAGYNTYWSGKHHGKENPIAIGFDRYYGLKDGCCNYFNPGPQRKGDLKPANKRSNREWCIEDKLFYGYTPEAKDFYTTDYFTHYAIDYIEDATKKEQPFFLYLAYTAPHDPLMAWPEDIAKYKGKYDKGFETVRKKRFKKQQELGLIDDSYTLSKATHKTWDNLSSEHKTFESKKMEVYAAMIDRMDQNIGRVIQKLESTDQLDNTIILFVSDNGASHFVVNIKDHNNTGKIGGIDRWVSLGKDWANVSNTPFRFYKQYSYEGGINTPLIAWWPKRIKANSFSKFSGHFVDIMATIVDITGAKYPKRINNEDITPMRGVSLLPILQGKNTKRTKPIYWQFGQGKALEFQSWKIVKHGNEPWDLYYLKDDPTETRNLASSNPKKVKELEKLFVKWYSSFQK